MFYHERVCLDCLAASHSTAFFYRVRARYWTLEFEPSLRRKSSARAQQLNWKRNLIIFACLNRDKRTTTLPIYRSPRTSIQHLISMQQPNSTLPIYFSLCLSLQSSPRRRVANLCLLEYVL